MAPKKPPVTSARRRAERASGSKKVAASTPQKRQTSVMQRPFQPGTRTSNLPSLPPGKKGGPLAKVTKTLPPGKKGGPLVKAPTTKPPQRALPPGKKGGPLSKLPKGTSQTAGKTLSTLGKAGRALGAAGTVLAIADTANSVFNPKSEGNQQLAKAMAAVNKRYQGKYGPRFKNANTGTVASKGAKSKAPMPKGSGDALREKSYASLQKFQLPKPKATAKPAAKASTPKASSAPTRSSAPARSSAPSRPTAKPAATRKPSAGPETEFSGMSVADMMKGYGMRVNQTFSAESAALAKKRQSLKNQTAEIKKMIEESKKRQGKG